MAYGNGGAGGTMPLGIANQAIGYSAGSLPVSAPPRPTVIPEQMSLLEKQVELLAGMVVELESRIDSVLMAAPPSPAQTSDRVSAPHPGVALGAALGSANDRITLVMQRLRNIIERVEL